MTATLTPTPDLPEIDVIDLRPKRSGRRVRNGIATVLMGFSVVAVLVPLRLRPRQRHPEGRVGACRGAS